MVWRFIIILLTAGVTMTGTARSADYPNRPVKIIVQYSPGGVPDLAGRLIAERLSKVFGQAFIVENRTGAGGTLATDLVAKSEPDGHTLLLAASGSMTISPALYRTLPFRVSDLAPVSLIGAFDFVMMSAPVLKGKSLAEIVEMAKKNPGKMNFASSGFGTEHHLLGELFKLATKAPLTHIPYKGFGPGATDVMANNIEIMFGSVPAASPLLRGNKLVALAVTGADRNPQLPEIPTFAELGVPDMRMTSWIGLLAPGATPQVVLVRLTQAVEEILKSKDVIERIEKVGLSPVPVGPDALAAKIKADTEFWASIVARSKMQQVD